MSIQHHPDVSLELPMPFIINLFHPATPTDTGRCTRLSHCFANHPALAVGFTASCSLMEECGTSGKLLCLFFSGFTGLCQGLTGPWWRHNPDTSAKIRPPHLCPPEPPGASWFLLVERTSLGRNGFPFVGWNSCSIPVGRGAGGGG